MSEETAMDNKRTYLDAAATAVAREAMENPGMPIPVDPDVAEHMGAFADDAMSEEDALESHMGVEKGVATGED